MTAHGKTESWRTLTGQMAHLGADYSHGKVTASIGNQNYEYDCTVSSTALTKNALLC